MKNKFLILLLFILPSVCLAQEFKLDGLKYRVIGTGNNVAVIGMTKKTSEVIIPDKIIYRGCWYNVKEIGARAFYEKKIEKVVIPDNITAIGEYAFSAKYDESGKGMLSEIRLPSNLECIGRGAFDFQSKLEDIKLPAKLKRINGFSYCSGLKSITIPEGVVSIEDHAFHDCGLENIEFPSTLQYIGEWSFAGCYGLKEISIPDNVTNIGERSFFCCSHLQRIKLPSNLQAIGKSAFEHCSWLREIDGYKEGVDYHRNELYSNSEGGDCFYETPFYGKIGRIPKGVGMLRVEGDGTISYAIMPFSSFLKANVEAEINAWQKKGEFESTEKWKARVSETTREAKIQELTQKYKQEYQALVKEYYVKAEQKKSASIDLSKLQLSAFDPDNESFMITGLPDADILLSVKTEDAPSFKQNWETIKKSASFEYVPNGSEVAIASVTFTNGQKKYTYDGKSDVKYGVTDVEYNFKPLELAMEENIEYNFDALEGVPTTTVQSLAQNKTKVEHKKVSVGNVSDVDKTIPNTYTNNSNTFAVIIGNENYQKVSKVQFAGNDAGIFAQYCKLTLGLPEKNIRCYNDATYATILSAVKDIKSIAQAYKGNLNVLFYYAGHGVPNESSNDAFLLPIDTDGRSTEVCYPLSKLYHELGSMNAKSVVVFMDACFSGAQRGEGMLGSARGVAIMAKPAAPQGNMVVFSAASGDETAYPYKEKNHGLFTYFLLKKLQETKGTVTLGELGSYIIDNVTKESVVSNGKSQTPTVSTSMSLDDSWRELKLK
ncbi:MAG: leucine-rich repeat protein [Prevotella sp.]|nr:leucine-rich repeat protein [Prevotella sp.]